MITMSTFEATKSSLTTAVQLAYEKNNLDLLCTKYASITSSAADKRTLLDQVLRDILHELLSKSPKDIEILESFITFTIQACRLELCTATSPVVFLGDIFDASTIDQSEKLFSYVENGVNIWKEELFFLPCKNNMLRMCNDLSRRLSRSQNPHFCGRILLFLAKFFPFSERSGLNIVSEFNLDNATDYGGDEEDVDMKEFSSITGEIKPEAKSTIDYNLYCKFWALQDFFRNPNQCFNKVDWKTFSSHTSHVLGAFNSFKLDDQGRRSQLDASAPASHQHYFAKYLTNQKLLELQLSDSNFRRTILFQLLITFQYLGSPVKFKSDAQELKADQKEWVKDTTEAVFRLMSETPPDGPEFVQIVRHMLAREDHWNEWKNKGCPSFKPPVFQPDPDDEPADKKRQLPVRPRRARKRLGDVVREAEAQNKYFMGNAELTRLWNINPNNLEACKSSERDFLPSLESYFEEAIQQTDPSAMVEENYKRVNDGNFGWRALRLLASRSPHFFTHSNNPINKLPEYLETMIRKIARDRPEVLKVVPAEPEVTSVAEEDQDVEVVEEDELLKTVKEEPMVVELPEDDETSQEVGGSEAKKCAFTEELIASIAANVAGSWRKLATKLAYTAIQMEVFAQGETTEEEMARKMLTNWILEDEDATPENLVYTLEGLGLDAAAALLKD